MIDDYATRISVFGFGDVVSFCADKSDPRTIIKCSTASILRSYRRQREYFLVVDALGKRERLSPETQVYLVRERTRRIENRRRTLAYWGHCIELSGGQQGYACHDAHTDQLLGILGHSVGPHGVSTGLFQSCKTTCPVQELGLEIIPQGTQSLRQLNKKAEGGGR